MKFLFGKRNFIWMAVASMWKAVVFVKMMRLKRIHIIMQLKKLNMVNIVITKLKMIC